MPICKFNLSIKTFSDFHANSLSFVHFVLIYLQNLIKKCFFLLFQVDCSETDPFVLDPDHQLGRIEVFNSLSVLAPQIELDRLRSDGRSNVTGECLNLKFFFSTNFELSISVVKIQS